MNQNQSNAFCVFRESEQTVHLLRVNDVSIVVEEFYDATTEGLQDESFKDEALREWILRCESLEALEAGASF